MDGMMEGPTTIIGHFGLQSNHLDAGKVHVPKLDKLCLQCSWWQWTQHDGCRRGREMRYKLVRRQPNAGCALAVQGNGLLQYSFLLPKFEWRDPLSLTQCAFHLVKMQLTRLCQCALGEACPPGNLSVHPRCRLCDPLSLTQCAFHLVRMQLR